MNTDYEDIRSLSPTEPKWFDENAVPRYCDFHPKEVADIYAREVCLLRIECQNCRHVFLVAMSWSIKDAAHKTPRLSDDIARNEIHYGDPPNINCCGGGPTMNSVPKAVLEFWSCETPHHWERVPQLEHEIDCGWDNDDSVLDEIAAGPWTDKEPKPVSPSERIALDFDKQFSQETVDKEPKL